MKKLNHSFFNFWSMSAVLAISVAYFITHLYQLTLLPVFADESIYIRWSQLIIDDWQRYLFFPLNDGKTPLQMWLMVPFQFMFTDSLFAGRFLSVLVGLGQVLINGYLVLLLGGRKKTAGLAMVLTAILPYWFFHHRMALTDGLLALWLSLMVVGLIRITRTYTWKQQRRWVVLTGLSFGLALMSKVPAVLILPTLILYPFLAKQLSKQLLITLFIRYATAVLLGFVIFSALALSPSFSQLFSRGGDFLYPINEVFLHGLWKQTVINIPNYISYFVSYMTWPIILLNLYALFSPTMKRTQWVLLTSAMLFAFPMMILGKVVYPRYFLPIAIFLTVSASLEIQEIIDRAVSAQSALWKKVIMSMIVVSLISPILQLSLLFMTASWSNSDATPFVAADKVQYLTEWSSGHGIAEVSQYLLIQSQERSIAVATEGYFGTLPDGILMYLHRQDLSNLYVEGIGQPVQKIPVDFIQRAKKFDQTLLVVNSHRLNLTIPRESLLMEYCRPYNAPCLQVWDITQMVQTDL